MTGHRSAAREDNELSTKVRESTVIAEEITPATTWVDAEATVTLCGAMQLHR